MTIIRQLGLYIMIMISLCLSSVTEAASKQEDIIPMLGCRACHQLNGKGGQIGPILDGIGQRMSRRELEQRLMSHEATEPKQHMPRYDYLFEPEWQQLLDSLEQQ
jgi:ubiquinol-cytochrome c reductase cytochrome b subunit